MLVNILCGLLLARIRLLGVMLLSGVVRLGGAPLSLPSSVTPEFQEFCLFGRALRVTLPTGKGGVVHLFVFYGYRGAEEDLDQLKPTDLALACSLAAGWKPDATCKFRREDCVGSRRDFIVGCSNAFAASIACWVTDRWFTPHFSVFASFCINNWTAEISCPFAPQPIWCCATGCCPGPKGCL